MSNLEKENELKNIELRIAQLEQSLLDTNKSKLDGKNSLDEKNNFITHNSLLLTQLHYAQEEIERIYLERESIKNELYKFIEDSEQQVNRLKKENQILLSQLHNLQEELYTNRESKDGDIRNRLRYGAAERIKKELPYVIGSTVIKNSKSLTGIAKLPLELVREIKGYEQPEVHDIDKYVDVADAQKVKEHLSYKIGKEILDSIETPVKFISLPTRLSKEILNFRINKDSKKDKKK